MELIVRACGCTEYNFRGQAIHNSSASIIKPCADVTKSLGFFTARKAPRGVTFCVNTVPLYCICCGPINDSRSDGSVANKKSGDSSSFGGAGRSRVCRCCLRLIVKTAKVREDCSTEVYCSNECLGRHEQFLDCCAPLLNAITQHCRNNSLAQSLESLLLLAVQLLYHRSVDTAGEYEEFFRRVFSLHHEAIDGRRGDHTGSGVDVDVDSAADWLSATVTRLGNVLLQKAAVGLFPLTDARRSSFLLSAGVSSAATASSNSRSDSSSGSPSESNGDSNSGSKKSSNDRDTHDDLIKPVLRHLFRVLRFNIQSIAYPSQHKELNNITVTTILPYFARINHSCAPNATLSIRSVEPDVSSSSHAGSAEVSFPALLEVSLVPLRDIDEGEEVTISYIQQLHMATSDRRTILLQLSGFHCECERCTHETAANDDRIDGPHIISMRSLVPTGDDINNWRRALNGMEEYIHAAVGADDFCADKTRSQRFIDCSAAVDVASVALLDARMAVEKSSEPYGASHQQQLLAQSNALMLAVQATAVIANLACLTGEKFTPRRISLLMHCGLYGKRLGTMLPLVLQIDAAAVNEVHSSIGRAVSCLRTAKRIFAALTRSKSAGKGTSTSSTGSRSGCSNRRCAMKRYQQLQHISCVHHDKVNQQISLLLSELELYS